MTILLLNDKTLEKFIIVNSPDGGFLQSEYWRKFQKSVGRKTHNISESSDAGEFLAFANIITHKLPVVGDYFYVPRGPILSRNTKRATQNTNKIQKFTNDLIYIAKKNNIGWIRIEPDSEDTLITIKENLPKNVKIIKSAVDMQPREIFLMDITKSEEDLLSGMKQKTRYNIRLSQKKGVCITCLPAGTAHNAERVASENIEEFLRLVKITAKRDRIKPHSESYYRQMFEIIPSEILKLYVAEYEGKIIAANLVLLFGKTATYMHGASDNEHRNVMAPYLLQWQQILDAKEAGCEKYDFGGVKFSHKKQPCLTAGRHAAHHTKNWDGITKFKTGFAPYLKPIEFPGCYDMVLVPLKYNLYRIIQRTRKLFL
jgi:peptidoglycan pentaglycine glycine transferase (the first glycine)